MRLRGRLVVFDLGRVLVRICDHWRHACEVAGIEPPLPHPLDPSARQALHAAVVEHETGRTDLNGFAAMGAAAVGTRPEVLVAISDAYVLGPFSGAVALLDDLSAAGVATACLSNINDNHWRIVQDAAHTGYFPIDRFGHRFASHLIGARKPEDAIYAHVERVAGFQGGDVVFFDDMGENVEAARRRGWDAHVVTDRTDPVSQVRRVLGLAPGP